MKGSTSQTRGQIISCRPWPSGRQKVRLSLSRNRDLTVFRTERKDGSFNFFKERIFDGLHQFIYLLSVINKRN